MPENDIPQFIKEIRTDMGFNVVELYQQAQKAITTLTPDQYEGALAVTRERVQQDYQAGKLDLIPATKIFLSVLQLSYKVNDFDSQIITLSNLGLMYQNARAYDVAITFVTEAIRISYKHNLLELKLKALNVLSLVYTNTQQSKKQTEVMEEVAEIHGKLGQMDKKAEMEALIKAKREFMALLGE
jgi:tetratricopeptide (TPR) repeat protein